MKPIKCAVCNKPVDCTEWYDDPETRLRVIRVHCHGETDEMRLNFFGVSLNQLLNMEESEGIAFDTKRIEHAPSG